MEKWHLLIHYVELDKMNNERKNVEVLYATTMT